jgi:DNA-binding transcriptional LysR family regulator
MRRVGESQRGEQGKLTVAMCVPITLLADVFEKFRKEYSGVSVEMDESTSSEGWALVQRRAIDVAFIAKPLRLGVARSLHLRNERMIAVLPKSHPQAGARRLSLEDLRLERFILCAGGLGPEIERHLARRMGKWGVEPRIQLHRLGQSNLINMVALGFGVTIIVGPAPRTAADGVVAIPLSSSNAVSLCAAWMESNPNPALKKLLEFLGPPSRFGRAKR